MMGRSRDEGVYETRPKYINNAVKTSIFPQKHRVFAHLWFQTVLVGSGRGCQSCQPSKPTKSSQ